MRYDATRKVNTTVSDRHEDTPDRNGGPMDRTDERSPGDDETATSAAGEGTERGPADAGLTTREYLRLSVVNPVSLLGVGVAVLGVGYVLATSPAGPFPGGDPLLGAGLLLGGVLVFAVGFSAGQRRLGARDDW